VSWAAYPTKGEWETMVSRARLLLLREACDYFIGTTTVEVARMSWIEACALIARDGKP
jgi:hypothetical protein